MQTSNFDGYFKTVDFGFSNGPKTMVIISDRQIKVKQDSNEIPIIVNNYLYKINNPKISREEKLKKLNELEKKIFMFYSSVLDLKNDFAEETS